MRSSAPRDANVQVIVDGKAGFVFVFWMNHLSRLLLFKGLYLCNENPYLSKRDGGLMFF